MLYRRPLPPAAYLRECLDYRPDTGRLFWRERPLHHFTATAKQTAEHKQLAWNGGYAGKEAFTATSRNGYATGGLNALIYRAHRVIWKLVHDEEADDIDHIDGDRRNNRLSNLRSVTRGENMKNARLRKDNTSGVVGVGRCRGDRWRAQIKAGGVHFVREFASFEDALVVRKRAEVDLGFHPNHGRAA